MLKITVNRVLAFSFLVLSVAAAAKVRYDIATWSIGVAIYFRLVTANED